MVSILRQVQDASIRNLIRGMYSNSTPAKRNIALHKICKSSKSSQLFSTLQFLNEEGLTDHLLNNETSANLKQLFSLPQITIRGANKEIVFQVSRVLHNKKKVIQFFSALKELDGEILKVNTVRSINILEGMIDEFGYSHILLARLALLHVTKVEEEQVQEFVNRVLEGEVNRNYAPYYFGFYDLFDLSDYYQSLLFRVEDRFKGGYGLENPIIAEWYKGIFFPHCFGSVEFANRVAAYSGSSIFDVAFLLATQSSDVRLERNSKNLITKELGFVCDEYFAHFEDLLDVELFYGKSAEDIYRISAWLAPSSPLFQWRRLLDKTFSYRKIQVENLDRFHKLHYDNSYFSKALELKHLAHKSTTQKFDLCEYSPQTECSFLRTSALLHCLLKGEQFESLDQTETRKVLSQTQNLAIHFSKLEINRFYSVSRESNELVTAFLALCLLFDKEPNDDVEFDMRMQFQETVQDWFAGDVLEFIKWLANRTPELAHYVFRLCSNTFIEKLYMLVPTFDDVLDLKEKILRWAADDLDMKEAKTLADEVARERLIRKVRGNRDDSRIFVDDNWLSDWSLQNIHPSLSKYVRSMKGTSLSEVSTNFVVISFDGVSEIREVRAAGQNHLLTKALAEVYYEFCTNKVYGIRSFLGRRILHGTLKGHLYKPVKQIVYDDKYLKLRDESPYWNNLENWLGDYEKIITEMQTVYLRVKSEAHPEGLIDPSIVSNSKKRTMVQRFVNNITFLVENGLSASEIIEVLPDWCWQIIQVDLSVIQTKYLVNIRERVLRELTSVVSQLAGRQKLQRLQIAEIYSHIENTHRNFSTWFRRPESKLMAARVMDLVETIIVGLHHSNREFQPKISYLEEKEITIYGRSYHLVYDILDILIGNAERWGQRNGDLEISRQLKPVGGKTKLIISVSSEFRDGSDVESMKSRIKRAMETEDLDGVTDQVDFTGIRRIRRMLAEQPGSKFNFDASERATFTFAFDMLEV